MKMVLLTALGVGGATIFGSLIGFVFKKISHRFSDIVLSFAAGVMLSAAVLGLILPSIEHGGGGTYGLLIAIVIASGSGLMSGEVSHLTTELGFRYFCASIPIAFGGLVSAILQSKTACAGINMIAKRPGESGKAMIMTVMVETYAILALLISFLLVLGIN